MKGPAGLSEVRKAYEYSVDRIGQGAGAGPLWAEYLEFLQHARPGSAGHGALFGGGVAGQEDSNRIAVVRCVPFFPRHNLEPADTSCTGERHASVSTNSSLLHCWADERTPCLQARAPSAS